MAKRYNPPPNWPAPPAGWTPPPGWQPDAAWGPVPPGWKLWVDDRNWFVRHKVLTGLGAFVVLIVAISAATSGGDKTDTTNVATADTATTDSSSAAPSQQTTSAPAIKSAKPKPKSQIGEGRRDGKFRFTVTSVECGKKQIGTSDFGVKAQGKFCLVSMKVKNIGDKPQTLFGDNQKMFVGDAQYGANTEAGIYLDDSQSFIEEINPGNTLTGVVVFDVPKNAKPTKLELHDSAFSGGVDVTL